MPLGADDSSPPPLLLLLLLAPPPIAIAQDGALDRGATHVPAAPHAKPGAHSSLDAHRVRQPPTPHAYGAQSMRVPSGFTATLPSQSGDDGTHAPAWQSWPCAQSFAVLHAATHAPDAPQANGAQLSTLQHEPSVQIADAQSPPPPQGWPSFFLHCP